MEDRPLEDRQLLQRFVKDNSQEAFAALTARYLNLVYAVCRREMGDADAAEDVTQAVFLILARKAPSLGRNVVLSGWLFQTARFAAKNARLTAQRRVAYEQKAAEALMEQQTQTKDEQWAEIEPLLNQSLAALKAADRDCLLLRFFQGASFAEVGASLGLSEDAARKRVTRSLGKMRQFFTKNGVIVPAIALPVLLTAHAAKAAPAACQAGIAKLTAGVLAGHTTAALTGSHPYQLSEGTLKAMKLVQLKIAVGVTAAAVFGVSTYALARGVSHPPAGSDHIYHQATGTTLTAVKIAARSRAAYGALASYEIISNVSERSLFITKGTVLNTQASATIRFVRPGKIRTEGMTTGGMTPFAYVSDGARTVFQLGSEPWKPMGSTEMAFAGADGISAGAGTTVPDLLTGNPYGYPLALSSMNAPKLEVREDQIAGVSYYVLTGSYDYPTSRSTDSVWIDEKTFLLRRSVEDNETLAQTIPDNGQPFALPAMKMHIEQNFTNERINQPIPNSTFVLPVVQ